MVSSGPLSRSRIERKEESGIQLSETNFLEITDVPPRIIPCSEQLWFAALPIASEITVLFLHKRIFNSTYIVSRKSCLVYSRRWLATRQRIKRPNGMASARSIPGAFMRLFSINLFVLALVGYIGWGLSDRVFGREPERSRNLDQDQPCATFRAGDPGGEDLP